MSIAAAAHNSQFLAVAHNSQFFPAAYDAHFSAAAHNSDFFAAAKTGEALKAGPIGLAVILLLCIASYFLFKSMSKHMRNVRENFPADAFPPPTGPVRPQASDFRPGGPRALDSSAGPGNGSVNMARAVPVDRDQPGEAPPPAEPGA